MNRSRKLIDLTGRAFGSWIVISKAPMLKRPSQVRTAWHCRCACGREKILDGQPLREGRSTRCGWCAGNTHRPGERIGTRVLVRRSKGLWRWHCDCGAKGRSGLYSLRATVCQQCGMQDHKHPRARSITIAGETHSLKGWGEKLGLSRYTVSLRIKHGWPVERACTTPRIPKSLSRVGWEAA